MPFYDLVMTFDVTSRSTPRLNGAGDIAVDASVTAHLESLERSTSPATPARLPLLGRRGRSDRRRCEA